MQNEDVVRFKHILDASVKISEFIKDKQRNDLDNNEQLGLAVIRLLEIIGEAANNISDNVKDKYPDLPWYSIVATRNRLIHGYFDVDMDIIWNIITKDLPALIIKVKEILG